MAYSISSVDSQIVCVCCACDNKAEKAQLICVPDQILKEAQRKRFKKE